MEWLPFWVILVGGNLAVLFFALQGKFKTPPPRQLRALVVLTAVVTVVVVSCTVYVLVNSRRPAPALVAQPEPAPVHTSGPALVAQPEAAPQGR